MGTSTNIDLFLIQEEGTADVGRAEGIVETIEEVTDKAIGPPKATVARRAKSYSDFYDVVRAHLKKERESEKQKAEESLSNELEFVEWFNDINDELLEASHEEYQYVAHNKMLAWRLIVEY